MGCVTGGCITTKTPQTSKVNKHWPCRKVGDQNLTNPRTPTSSTGAGSVLSCRCSWPLALGSLSLHSERKKEAMRPARMATSQNKHQLTQPSPAPKCQAAALFLLCVSLNNAHSHLTRLGALCCFLSLFPPSQGTYLLCHFPSPFCASSDF
ncbi:hypothetical protein LZ32DRAFT_73747 [Colletotrichum eremochloae]|nr:hypothetical protein LZ32DRAFT_73747 [Colletotrichum eremochloae]